MRSKFGINLALEGSESLTPIERRLGRAMRLPNDAKLRKIRKKV